MVELRESGAAISMASGAGDGGAILVEADGLSLSDGQLLTTTAETASGQGGNIAITAGSVELRPGEQDEGSSIVTLSLSSGDAGDIEINADRLFADGENQLLGAVIQTSALSEGSRGGVVRFDVGDLALLRGGVVLADPSDGPATIDVTADTIRIDGGGSGRLTGLQLNVLDGESDRPGAIVIRAGELKLQNGGIISSRTTDDVDAGDILITVDRLTLEGEDPNVPTRITSDSTIGSSGDAGRVVIVADIVDISGSADISSSTGGSGNGGVVDISASRSLQLSDGSSIDTFTASTATGDAGSIIIATPELSVLDGASISALTGGVGAGGFIRIDASNILLDNGNLAGFSGITA